MDDAEREKRYREAMAARRSGERCPLCFEYHGTLESCKPISQVFSEMSEMLTPPLARTSDVETSHAAAAAGDKRALRFRVLGLYYQQDPGNTYHEEPEGLVDDDLAIYAGFPDGHESYRRRGSDLRALGWTEWLFDAEGSPVRRKTTLGSTARVSVITPLGRAVWENHHKETA